MNLSLIGVYIKEHYVSHILIVCASVCVDGCANKHACTEFDKNESIRAYNIYVPSNELGKGQTKLIRSFRSQV